MYYNTQYALKLRSVTFGALVVNKQNCMHLTEEHYSRSYFSVYVYDESRKNWATQLHSGTLPEPV